MGVWRVASVFTVALQQRIREQYLRNLRQFDYEHSVLRYSCFFRLKI
jgi:hypothetical protein